MEDQQRFLEIMKVIKETAASGNQKITKEKIDKILGDLRLSDEQLQLVYGYLKSNHISISGVDIKNNYYEKMNTKHIENARKIENQNKPEDDERDKKIVEMYARDLEILDKKENSAFDEKILIQQIISGDKEAEHKLIERYLKRIVEWINPFKGRGIAESDLIQEANLAFLLFIDEIKKEKVKIVNFEHELSSRIKAVCGDILKEHEKISIENTRLLNKINAVNECASSLAETLGRKVTVEEVAEELGISVAEVMETVDLSMKKIENMVIGKHRH